MRALSARSSLPATQPSLLKARWAVIASVCLLVVVGTLLADHLSHRSYASSASVVLSPEIFANGAEPLAPDLGTAKQVANSTVVLRPVSRATGTGLLELRSALSVSNPADTDVLVFTYRATTPTRAQHMAQAVAAAFCSYQNAPLAAVLHEEAAVAAGKAAPHGSSLSVEQATIISPADLPTRPAGHSLALDLLVALIAGLGLGLGAALFSDRASNALQSRSDIESHLGRPLLGEFTTPWSKAPADPVGALLADPATLAALRGVRLRLQDLAGNPPSLSVVVTRPLDKVPGGLPLSLGLAVSLALSGRRVVLVGSNLRSQHIGRLFGAEEVRGLTQLLKEQTWTPCLMNSSLPGLRLLVEGADSAGSEELFDRDRISWLLSALGVSGVDAVVIDAPSLDAPETLALVAASTSVVLELDRRRTGRSQLQDAVSALGAHKDELIGAVLTQSRRALGLRYFDKAIGRAKGKYPTEETTQGLSLQPASAPLAPLASFRGRRNPLRSEKVPQQKSELRLAVAAAEQSRDRSSQSPAEGSCEAAAPSVAYSRTLLSDP